MSPDVPSTAVSMAAEVRAGRRPARELTDEAIAAVAARDGEFNSFLHVLADEARRRPTPSTPRWPWVATPGRWPVCRSR